jgi:hypothetical protein
MEPPIVTSGVSVMEIARFLRGDVREYGASEVVEYLTRESCAVAPRRAVTG